MITTKQLILDGTVSVKYVDDYTPQSRTITVPVLNRKFNGIGIDPLFAAWKAIEDHFSPLTGIEYGSHNCAVTHAWPGVPDVE